MAEYLGSFRPFAAPPNEAKTPRPEQIEGIAVITYKDNSVKIKIIPLKILPCCCLRFAAAKKTGWQGSTGSIDMGDSHRN